VTKPQLREFLIYVAAAAVYIGIGLYNVDFLLSWPVAAAYLFVTAWLVPAGIRRLWARRFR
jgi:hypothetical protein